MPKRSKGLNKKTSNRTTHKKSKKRQHPATKSRKSVCEHHTCKNTENPSLCPHCEKIFCEEHIAPKLPKLLTFYSKGGGIDDELTLRDQNKTHACPDYYDYLEEQHQKKVYETLESLDRIGGKYYDVTPKKPWFFEPEKGKYVPKTEDRFKPETEEKDEPQEPEEIPKTRDWDPDYLKFRKEMDAHTPKPAKYEDYIRSFVELYGFGDIYNLGYFGQLLTERNLFKVDFEEEILSCYNEVYGRKHGKKPKEKPKEKPKPQKPPRIDGRVGEEEKRWKKTKKSSLRKVIPIIVILLIASLYFLTPARYETLFSTDQSAEPELAKDIHYLKFEISDNGEPLYGDLFNEKNEYVGVSTEGFFHLNVSETEFNRLELRGIHEGGNFKVMWYTSSEEMPKQATLGVELRSLQSSIEYGSTPLGVVSELEEMPVLEQEEPQDADLVIIQTLKDKVSILFTKGKALTKTAKTMIGSECEDGTPTGNCSVTQPLYCKLNGELVQNTVKCGCPEGQRGYWGECIELIECSDGTLDPECSENKPYLCDKGTLVEKSSVCGCPDDNLKTGESCYEIQRCNDRTMYGDCSTNKPLYCNEGQLIEKASICGCSSWGDSQVDGDTCIDPTAEPKEDCKAAFQYVNELRAQYGRKSLEWDENIYALGVERSRDMYERNYFDHVTPEGTCAKDLKAKYGLQQYSIAENAGAQYTGYTDADMEFSRTINVRNQVDGWMESRGHRYNLLYESHTRGAIACYHGVCVFLGANTDPYGLGAGECTTGDEGSAFWETIEKQPGET